MSPVIKKKRKKITISSKYLLLLFSGICVALMIFTFRTSVFEGPLKRLASYAVVPFQKGIAAVGSYLSDRTVQFARLEDVLLENEQLKQQIDALTLENNRLQQERYELNNLRALYELDQTYDEYEKIGARVIANEGDNWFYSFVIDKGEEDGIVVDCNVMAGSGLVGRVVSVGPNYAKVQSIINDTSNVSGTVLATSENLVVSGDLQAVKTDGLIRFSQLTDRSDRVSVGDKIVTSNISDKYLPGILIGYISSINTTSDNLTKSGYLMPAVDFFHLEEVLVVTQLKQQTGE